MGGGSDAPGLAVCGLAATATHASGPNPRGVVVDDLNSDGRIDVVVPTEDSLLPVLLGTSSDAFMETLVPAGVRPVSIAVADFTEDGRLDMAVSNSYTDPSTPPTLSVLRGNADGSYSRLAQAITFSAFHLVAADFNHDGHKDLLASSTTGVRVFPGTGAGTFVTTQPEMMLGQTPTFEVADIDGDGLLDLLSLSAFQLAVHASSTAMTTFYETGGVYPRDLAIGDLDADNDLDVAVVNGDNDTVRLFFNTAGSFAAHTDVPTDLPPGSDGAGMGSGSNLGACVPWNVAIGDFTADGANDILVLIAPYAPVGEASVLLVLARSGPKTFQPMVCSLTPRPVDVVAGDFVGDSRTDAIIVAAPYDASTGGKVMILQQVP
jgi:hypothetical protein